MDALHHLLFHTTPLDDMPVNDDYRIKTYAIVDCASDEQNYKQLLSQDLKHAILYKDEDASNLETVAPYLIELDPEHDYTQWLLQEQWGTHSVIYIKSHYALEPLAEHFRRYTKVVVEPRENDNRNETLAFFAFYDPRVLKNYFTVLTKEQMSEFCQPVISFSYEDEEQPEHLLTSYLSHSGEQWHTQVVAFKEVKAREKDKEKDQETATQAETKDNASNKVTDKADKDQSETDITEQKTELTDELDIPVMPVIFTIAQQNQFDELQRQKFCQQLLLDLQGHYDVSPKDIDAAVLYSQEADKLGLHSEVTQSRYILIGLLIEDSPIKRSKYLKQSLQLDTNEKAQAVVLDQALEELTHKERLHVR